MKASLKNQNEEVLSKTVSLANPLRWQTRLDGHKKAVPMGFPGKTAQLKGTLNR